MALMPSHVRHILSGLCATARRLAGWKSLAMVVRYCGETQHSAREALVKADGLFG